MVLKKALPFSESFDEYNQNGNSAIIFGLMLFVALFAGLHFASTFLPYGIYLYLGIGIICLVTIWRLAFNVSWEQIIKG
jgi:ABC-2 type transport system permease protein